jgi:hypothetical protein
MGAYVALEDVTVHKKNDGDDNEVAEQWGNFSAVTLVPGESIRDTELAKHQVEAYKKGDLSHLLLHVNNDVAGEIQKSMEAGEGFDIKMIKNFVLSGERKGAAKKGDADEEKGG